MQNILLIIDPQYDFISGSLAVKGAEQAMDNLVTWMQKQQESIDGVFITTDQHPFNHCSFTQQGGPWPMHCIKYSMGAAITDTLQPILINFANKGVKFKVLQKGRDAGKEQYSAFKPTVPEEFFDAERIYVAGIAGDFCVFESISDLVAKNLASKLVILSDCIASIDGGAKLRECCNQHQLLTIFGC